MWEDRIMLDEHWEECILVTDLGVTDDEGNRFVVRDEEWEFYLTRSVSEKPEEKPEVREQIIDLNKMMGMELPDFLKDMLEDAEKTWESEEDRIRKTLSQIGDINPIKIVKTLATIEARKMKSNQYR